MTADLVIIRISLVLCVTGVRAADAHRPLPRQLRADTSGSIAHRLCKCIGYITSRHSKSSCTPSSRFLELPRYIAIFPYDAQQEDELSFPADAILEILDPDSTSGWFKARLGDQTGLIPFTYVQPVDTQIPRKWLSRLFTEDKYLRSESFSRRRQRLSALFFPLF